MMWFRVIIVVGMFFLFLVQETFDRISDDVQIVGLDPDASWFLMFLLLLLFLFAIRRAKSKELIIARTGQGRPGVRQMDGFRMNVKLNFVVFMDRMNE
jgi:hypothetical protein